MVNTRSGRENQDASVMARVKASLERGPQPQKETTGNQDTNSRLSIMAEIQQMIRDMKDQNQEQIHKIIDEKMGSILNGVIKPCSYKTFLSCQPPEFSGSTDPTAILNWITEMEMTFDLCECREDQKVKFAGRMLKGSAFSWWNVTRMLLGDEIVSHLTWAEFVEKVKGRYCSNSDVYLIGEGFFLLKKGNMTVDEYACLFVEKLQYVGYMARSDEDCVKRFVAGLPFKYDTVRLATTLDSAIQVAKMVEENENKKEEEEWEDVGEKRKWGETSESLKKSKGEVKSCYRCGKVGHLVRECWN